MTVPRSVSLATLSLLGFSMLILSTQAQVPPPPGVPAQAPTLLPGAPTAPTAPALPAIGGVPKVSLLPAFAPPSEPALPLAAPCPQDPASVPAVSCIACHRSNPHASGPHPVAAMATSCIACHQVAHPPAVRTYRVKKGDSLYKIAHKVGIPVAQGVRSITAQNPGLDPNHLSVGQTLRLPATRKFRVMPVLPVPHAWPQAVPVPHALPPDTDPLAAPRGRLPSRQRVHAVAVEVVDLGSTQREVPHGGLVDASVDQRIQRLEAMVRQLQAELKTLKGQKAQKPRPIAMGR